MTRNMNRVGMMNKYLNNCEVIRPFSHLIFIMSKPSEFFAVVCFDDVVAILESMIPVPIRPKMTDNQLIMRLMEERPVKSLRCDAT